MSPVINLARARLDVLGPFAVSPNVRDAVRTQDPHYFAHADIAEVFRYDQVYKVIDVRQAIASQFFDRYGSVDFE
jgi:hypothetical protein